MDPGGEKVPAFYLFLSAGSAYKTLRHNEPQLPKTMLHKHVNELLSRMYSGWA